MLTISKIKAKNIIVKNNGFTLNGVIVVIAILGILISIAVPKFTGVMNHTEKQVCFSSCLQLERMYYADLILIDREHAEIIFSAFLNEYVGNVCPGGGEIVYIDGKVRCKLHDEVDVDDESVPYL
jgi:hypothetical protein